MESKLCVECGSSFMPDKFHPYQRYCSTRCICRVAQRRYTSKHMERIKESQQKYYQSEKGKANQKRKNQNEKGKARKKRYDQSEKGKEYYRQWNKTEKAKARHKKHRQTDKYKKAVKRYWQSDKGKLTRKKQVTKRKRGLGFVVFFDNPFPDNISFHFHHVNDLIVVPCPEYMHRYTTKSSIDLHRNQINEKLVGLYGVDFDELLSPICVD